MCLSVFVFTFRKLHIFVLDLSIESAFGMCNVYRNASSSTAVNWLSYYNMKWNSSSESPFSFFLPSIDTCYAENVCSASESNLRRSPIVFDKNATNSE